MGGSNLRNLTLLKESLPLLPKLVEDWPKYPRWVVESHPTKAKSISVLLEAPVDLKLKVTPPRSKASDVVKLRAQAFGKLLKAGLKPGEAAHKLHTTVRELMSKEQTQKEVREIIEGYHLDAAARKLLQRALVNRGVLESVDEKLKLDYLKLLAEDSELGIKTAAPTQINVGLDPGLKAFLDATVPVAELAPPEKEEPLEGEIEDK